MRYLLGHLDDAPGTRWQESDPREEVYVTPPGTRVVIAVPLGVLERALPILHAAAAGHPPATCACCGATLPAPTAPAGDDADAS